MLIHSLLGHRCALPQPPLALVGPFAWPDAPLLGLLVEHRQVVGPVFSAAIGHYREKWLHKKGHCVQKDTCKYVHVMLDCS